MSIYLRCSPLLLISLLPVDQQTVSTDTTFTDHYGNPAYIAVTFLLFFLSGVAVSIIYFFSTNRLLRRFTLTMLLFDTLLYLIIFISFYPDHPGIAVLPSLLLLPAYLLFLLKIRQQVAARKSWWIYGLLIVVSLAFLRALIFQFYFFIPLDIAGFLLQLLIYFIFIRLFVKHYHAEAVELTYVQLAKQAALLVLLPFLYLLLSAAIGMLFTLWRVSGGSFLYWPEIARSLSGNGVWLLLSMLPAIVMALLMHGYYLGKKQAV